MGEKAIPNYRILTVLLATFIAGVFVASFFNLNFYKIYFLELIFLLVIFAVSFIFKKYFIWIITFASTVFFAGFLLFSFVNTKLTNIVLPFDQIQEFSGVISSYPNISDNSQNFYLKTSDFGQLSKIYFSTNRFPEYSYGDKITVKGTISKPKNFSSFDWASYLKRFGTVAEIKNPEINLIPANNEYKILSLLYNIRKKFEIAVQKNLPEPESSLAIGLLIGSKQGFSDSLLNDFSRVGITHIIALSGYNVTIIIIFLTDILLGYVSRKKIFLFSVILISGFVVMTGAAPSVLRAAIITLLIAYGKTIGRRADMTNLILLSATIMIIINPFILKNDVGFQLSFLAFIGLVYFSPILSNFFQKKTFRTWPNFIKSALSETLSAQIFVLPLILSVFGIVSIISPLTNVLILPTIPATMLFIFLSTIIYWILPTIGHLAFLITLTPLKYVILVTQYFAQLPISAVSLSGIWRNIALSIYIILIAWTIFKNRKVYDHQTN